VSPSSFIIFTFPLPSSLSPPLLRTRLILQTLPILRITSHHVTPFPPATTLLIFTTAAVAV
jgi:hypothetical protein